jgi:hypothetical protein
VLNPLAVLPCLSKANQHRFLRYCRYLNIREYFGTPMPVAFALRATACMFALLFIMPAHPLAVPTAIGGALSLALILQNARVRKILL